MAEIKYGSSEPVADLVLDGSPSTESLKGTSQLYSTFLESTGQDFEMVFDNSLPLKELKPEDFSNFYTSFGLSDPDEQSVLSHTTEAISSVLAFSEVLSKRMQLVSTEILKADSALTDLIVQILTELISAALGLTTSGLSMSISSILGSILSALGLGIIAELLGLKSKVDSNIQAAKDNQNKFEKEQGKYNAASLQAIREAVDNTAGIVVNTANVQQTNAEVVNINATAGTNIDSASYTLASQSITENSRFRTQVADLFKGSYSHYEIKSDSSITFYSKTCHRYHAVALREIAAEADIISSFRTDYSDFRWTQTGQYGPSITGNIGNIINEIFGIAPQLASGVHVNVATLAQVNVAQLLANINYGRVYTIDSDFTFINSGIGRGLAGLPLKAFAPISEFNGTGRTDAIKPQPVVEVNEKTREVGLDSPSFDTKDVGKIFTRIKDATDASVEAAKKQTPPTASKPPERTSDNGEVW